MGAHDDNAVKTIWKVFLILLVITGVEVVLGILRPEVMSFQLLGTSLLNWTFLILTLVKAYYIVWYFMHLKDEKPGFRMSITLPLYVLIPYATIILLIEAGYIHEVLFK